MYLVLIYICVLYSFTTDNCKLSMRVLIGVKHVKLLLLL